MGSTEYTQAGDARAYDPPAICDYGSLRRLTADFDVQFMGSVLKAATFAAVSAPVIGGGGGIDASNAGTPTATTPSVPIDSSSVLPGQGTGTDGVSPTTDLTGIVPTADHGDVLGGSGSSGGAGTVAAGGGGGGGDGRLPFTGLAVMVLAGVGVAFSSAGVALRTKLRRRP